MRRPLVQGTQRIASNRPSPAPGTDSPPRVRYANRLRIVVRTGLHAPRVGGGALRGLYFVLVFYVVLAALAFGLWEILSRIL